MRLTKIICTIGPSTDTLDGMRRLAESGMNIVRMNFSHGTHEESEERLRNVDAINAEGYSIARLLDTKGAEIRTGVVDTPIPVEPGAEFVFSSHPLPNEDRPIVMVNYDSFAKDTAQTDRILVDNGEMNFEIVSIDEKNGFVIARALDSGEIGSRRHINLPGADIDLPSITDKDWKDLEFGAKKQFDYTALSFIRTAQEIRDVRAFLDKHNAPNMKIIAKIETKKAVDNIEEIIAASDGIMVARGDLGAELPFETIPAIQDRIVERCRYQGKPVIIATHMLESMIEHPMPTRAEATDVAHAVVTRADATMLSGETAKSDYPFKAVATMDKILQETEKRLPSEPALHCPVLDEYGARAEAAASMARSLNVSAVVILTRSGKSARAMSNTRLAIPIIGVAASEEVARSLQLFYGVHPVPIAFDDNPEETVKNALAECMKKEYISKGQRIVLVADTRTESGITNAVQLRTL